MMRTYHKEKSNSTFTLQNQPPAPLRVRGVFVCSPVQGSSARDAREADAVALNIGEPSRSKRGVTIPGATGNHPVGLCNPATLYPGAPPSGGKWQMFGREAAHVWG